jgi:hypothetical protein
VIANSNLRTTMKRYGSNDANPQVGSFEAIISHRSESIILVHLLLESALEVK